MCIEKLKPPKIKATKYYSVAIFWDSRSINPLRAILAPEA